MIFLIITGIILFILTAILFLPININISLKEEFILKIKLFGIKVYEFSSRNEEKKKSSENKKAEKTADKKSSENTAKSTFSALKNKYGFSMAIKEIFGFLMECFSHIKGFLRHIKIKEIRLNILVATPNAAKTAIEYGIVCSAVYPVLALIDTIPNIEFKKINVKSDFNSDEGKFDFSFDTKLQVFFALISAFKIYKEYKNFIIRIEENERE